MCVDGLWDLIEGDGSLLPEVLSSAKLEHQTTAREKNQNQNSTKISVSLGKNVSEFDKLFIINHMNTQVILKYAGNYRLGNSYTFMIQSKLFY